MKGVYILAIIMFLGLFVMFYSQYRVMNIVGQRNVTAPAGENSPKREYPSIGIADPEVMPYITGSFVGLALFVVGAVGGVIVVVKTFTRRF
jgi:hypothetical protein